MKKTNKNKKILSKLMHRLFYDEIAKIFFQDSRNLEIRQRIFVHFVVLKDSPGNF